MSSYIEFSAKVCLVLVTVIVHVKVCQGEYRAYVRYVDYVNRIVRNKTISGDGTHFFCILKHVLQKMYRYYVHILM